MIVVVVVVTVVVVVAVVVVVVAVVVVVVAGGGGGGGGGGVGRNMDVLFNKRYIFIHCRIFLLVECQLMYLFPIPILETRWHKSSCSLYL